MSAWSHLPNAALIDRILADLRLHPSAWDKARAVAWSAAREADWVEAQNAAWSAAWGVARVETRDAARAAAVPLMEAAWGAIAALIAWDHAGSYLDLPRDQIQTLMFLGDHVAILLLPAVIALESQTEML